MRGEGGAPEITVTTGQALNGDPALRQRLLDTIVRIWRGYEVS